jgi:tetratricopeptide (TPR) repeat protein
MRIWKSAAVTVAAVAVTAVIYEKVVYGQQTAPAPQTASQAGNPPAKAASAPGQTSRRGHDWGARTAVRLSPEVVKARRDAMAPSEALRLHGQALYKAGDLAGAEQAYLKALDAAPDFGGYVKLSAPLIGRQLGQVYLKDGKYDQAIYWLSGARKSLATVGGGLDLDLALAYVRLSDYKNASRFYSDQSSLQYLSEGEGVLSQDLPGTDSPRALEASILFARGLDVYLEHRHDDALVDFQAANHLVPENALIAYYCANILSEKGRLAEAAPLYECAATGRGEIGKEGKLHLGWVKSDLAAGRAKP